MMDDYKKKGEDALLEADRPEEAAVPEAAEPEAAEPEAAEPDAAKPKKKTEPKAEKPRDQPRMICEGCGRSYSIHTKRHKCRPPAGFVPALPKGGQPSGSEKKPELPPPPPIPGPVERQITLSDVTEFLFGESKARRQQRRDDLLAKML